MTVHRAAVVDVSVASLAGKRKVTGCQVSGVVGIRPPLTLGPFLNERSTRKEERHLETELLSRGAVRVLDDDLEISGVNGEARIVQDDLENTYAACFETDCSYKP